MAMSPQDAAGDQTPTSAQRGRAGRVSPRIRAQSQDPSPEERASEPARTFNDSTADADDAPHGDDPAERFAHLVTAVGRLLTALQRASPPGLHQIVGDPLSLLITAAERLGVEWPVDAGEMTDFIRSRLAADAEPLDTQPESLGHPSAPGEGSGFDPEFTDAALLPVLRRLADRWFRVEIQGVENLPVGAGLLVANHAGALPLDALVLQSMVFDSTGRHLRTLGADLIFQNPQLGHLARKTGAVPAHRADAQRLLGAGQLVSVFPEGFKGLGKPYAQRYRLQRFGRGGFVSVAVRAQAPIVPVSIVGSEEIYPQVGQLPGLARKLGLPYVPITPLFPLLGVFGMVPLPSKWVIRIGEQIATDELPPTSAEDPATVFGVTEQVRETIQHTLDGLVVERGGAFG